MTGEGWVSSCPECGGDGYIDPRADNGDRLTMPCPSCSVSAAATRVRQWLPDNMEWLPEQIIVDLDRLTFAVLSPDLVSAPARTPSPLPLHRTEAGHPQCSTCDGSGCPDCTDPS